MAGDFDFTDDAPRRPPARNVNVSGPGVGSSFGSGLGGGCGLGLGCFAAFAIICLIGFAVLVLPASCAKIEKARERARTQQTDR